MGRFVTGSEVQFVLRRSGLATACSPPISSALALNRDAYIGALP